MSPDRLRKVLAALVVAGALGLGLVAAEPAMATVTRYQQNDAAVTLTASWLTDTNAVYSGGTATTVLSSSSRWAEFRWTVAAGMQTAVTMIGYRFTNYAIAPRWRVDGGAWTTFTERGADYAQFPAFTTGQIGEGAHLLEVENNSEGTTLSLDAFDVDTTTAPTTTTTTTAPTTTTTTAPATTTTTTPATTTTTLPPTTTTTTTPGQWQPVSTAGRAAACAWEWGGTVEAVPARCDDVGEVSLPGWLLLAVSLSVFAAFAALVSSWRHS